MTTREANLEILRLLTEFVEADHNCNLTFTQILQVLNINEVVTSEDYGLVIVDNYSE